MTGDLRHWFSPPVFRNPPPMIREPNDPPRLIPLFLAPDHPEK